VFVRFTDRSKSLGSFFNSFLSRYLFIVESKLLIIDRIGRCLWDEDLKLFFFVSPWLSFFCFGGVVPRLNGGRPDDPGEDETE